MNKLTSFLHKLVWLYLIGGFTAFSLFSSSAFAQNAGGGGVGFYDPSRSAGINVGGAGTDQGEGILDIFKNFINYALGFLALIAFAMLIWGGYKMVASGGDEEAYKEGIKVLKNAAIGIAFIAVSWFLVTFIFFAIGAVVW